MTNNHAATDAPEEAALLGAKAVEPGIVTCDACPVLCRIRPGKTGACDRYGNVEGALARMDPLTVAVRSPELVRFAGEDWTGNPIASKDLFVTAIGAGTTYPDYKPAPFIVGSEIDGVDMVTVVSEGVFSYCGLKVKIDTDRHLGPETAPVRANGEAVGHVTTAEYGSQMLSLGGVHHLTGGSKKEGVVTCETMLRLANAEAVELSIDGGARVVVQSGRPPIVDGVEERRMRVGCGSATIGIFANQWLAHADEVIVVDDHITGVLTEHQAGRFLDMRPAGIRVRGRRSTPGRYFQVANPGMGWGGTDIEDPLAIIEKIDPKMAWPGLRLLMVSTTGEHAGWFVLDEASGAPNGADAGGDRRCGGADWRELRAGVVHRAVHGRCGRFAAGGGDGKSRAADPVGAGRADPGDQRWGRGVCLAGRRDHLHGGCRAHAGSGVRQCADSGAGGADRVYPAAGRLYPAWWACRTGAADRGCGAGASPSVGDAAGRFGLSGSMSAVAALLPDGRLHLQHGPIDCLCRAWGDPGEVRAAYGPGGGVFCFRAGRSVRGTAVAAIALPSRRPTGGVARAMHAACMPFADRFITPMAAVAGAVADAVLAAMVEGRAVTRGFVNNGGDIAFHCAGGFVTVWAGGGIERGRIGPLPCPRPRRQCADGRDTPE